MQGKEMVSQAGRAEAQLRNLRTEAKVKFLNTSAGAVLSRAERGSLVVKGSGVMVGTEAGRMFMSQNVESLLLGLPLPQTVVFEDGENTWRAICGEEVLCSLLAFAQGGMMLTGLQVLTEFNGLRFVDFSEAARRKMLSSPMQVCVVGEESAPWATREVFSRLRPAPGD